MCDSTAESVLFPLSGFLVFLSVIKCQVRAKEKSIKLKALKKVLTIYLCDLS